MWIILAFGSAIFAGITSILAKCGIRKTDSTVATAIRTIVVLIFSWLMVFVTGSQSQIGLISGEAWLFLILSGISTGASWLCYFRALQLGDINKVVPIDKSSVILTILLAFIFLHEEIDLPKVIGVVLIGTGTFLMIEKKDVSVKQQETGRRWFPYAVGSAVFASLTSILGKIGISGVESNLGTAIRTSVVLVMAWLMVYVKGKQHTVDVSFTAKQGQVTALVGPSGGGKTTVSRLASRFWDIRKGKITVGGMDISKIDPESLMSLYSIVFQDVTLFNNTVMENIRLGRRDATDKEVLEAARLANVDEFAEKLPDKWNTLIGENGCELSGGERQRISIARAFLKDAPIILLDEATASLDVENETLIQESLSRLIKDKTVMIIAHRMRTVAGADKIVVLSEGTVAEQGNSDTLLKKNGIYAHMVKLQTQSQNWAME